jgi:hypothetical protein
MNNIIVLINLIKDSEVKKSDKQRAINQGYEISVKSWKKYCDKYNYQLFVIDSPVIDDFSIMKPHWNKMYILDILDSNKVQYNQIMYVDSDTIVHDNAPDVFLLTNNKFCVVRNYGCVDWMFRSLETYSKLLFDNYKLPYLKYFNSGMLIFNSTHKEFFKKMQNFYFNNLDKILYIQDKFELGNDQPVLNFLLDKYIRDDVKELPYEWNMQDMNRFEVLNDDMLHVKYGYISHYNCGIKPSPRVWMEKTYNYIYNQKN